ncbi:hypothetical protein MMPV_009070 [Pyropia vietnamensis]
MKLDALSAVATLCGWIYTTAWAVSGYPQVILIFRTGSVEGVSLDWAALNLTGFVAYAFYTCGSLLQEVRHPGRLTSHVEWNDAAFAVHGAALCALVAAQCVYYRRRSGDGSGGGGGFGHPAPTVRPGVAAALTASWAAFVVALVATVMGRLSWSHLLGGAAWAKVVASFLKYIPQAVHNARRRSTDGWSVGSVLGDTTGGVFSLAQQLTRCAQVGSWAPLVGNVAKLGLAAVSLSFDALFLTQHYWWYAGLSPVVGGAYGRLASEDEGLEMADTEGPPEGLRSLR